MDTLADALNADAWTEPKRDISCMSVVLHGNTLKRITYSTIKLS